MANYIKIQIRRDTSDKWEENNPVLVSGEIAADMTRRRLKIGNGTDNWANLGWINGDIDSSLEQVLRMLSGVTGGNLLDAVDNISDLSSVYPNPIKGDIVFVRNEDAFYTWDGSEWKLLTASGTNEADVNKLIDSKLNSFGTFGMGYTVDEFNGASKPTKITFDDGLVATLAWSGTRLNSITGSNGEKITMRYNANGLITGRTVERINS